ncbi:MAG: hypothetical protein COA40_00530 [Aequorivita sp.]|nr:MAG: hypothetical protein COA40_00530 [Aequorivita sp.]
MEFIAVRLKKRTSLPSPPFEGRELDCVCKKPFFKKSKQRLVGKKYQMRLNTTPSKGGVVLIGVYSCPVEEHPSPALPSKGGSLIAFARNLFLKNRNRG